MSPNPETQANPETNPKKNYDCYCLPDKFKNGGEKLAENASEESTVLNRRV